MSHWSIHGYLFWSLSRIYPTRFRSWVYQPINRPNKLNAEGHTSECKKHVIINDDNNTAVCEPYCFEWNTAISLFIQAKAIIIIIVGWIAWVRFNSFLYFSKKSTLVYATLIEQTHTVNVDWKFLFPCFNSIQFIQASIHSFIHSFIHPPTLKVKSWNDQAPLMIACVLLLCIIHSHISASK